MFANIRTSALEKFKYALKAGGKRRRLRGVQVRRSFIVMLDESIKAG
jgi:hypothetical protein